LEQDALNASVEFDALSRFLRLTKTFATLEAYIERGELPDAVELRRDLDRLLQDTPAHLNETKVIRDLKVGLHIPISLKLYLLARIEQV